MQISHLIEISKNRPAASVVIFTSSFFVGILALLFLWSKDKYDVMEIVIAMAVIIGNLIFSVWLVLGDYKMFLADNGMVSFKSGAKSFSFSQTQFENFKVTPINSVFSPSYKYFYLHVDGHRFRIRYYIDDYGLFNPFLDLNKEAKAIETDIRMRVNKLFDNLN